MASGRGSTIIARTVRYRTVRTGAVGGSLRARGTCEHDSEDYPAGETQSFDHRNPPLKRNVDRYFFRTPSAIARQFTTAVNGAHRQNQRSVPNPGQSR